MRICASAAFIAAVILTTAFTGQSTLAQGPRTVHQAAYSPALFGQGQNQLMDAHGTPAVIPAGYCQGGCQGGCCPPGYHGGYGGAYPCEDAFGGAGSVCEQCGPHYFDFSAEYVMYQRANYGSFEHTLATLNVLPGGTTVLSTGQISTDYEAGFRLMGRYDVGALSFLEFGYTGFFDMGDGRSFTDPTPVSATQGNLFSPFTNFGQNPVGGIPTGANPNDFDETDRAVFASSNIETELQTAEITFRRYWVGHNPRVSGTWLAGFRYTRLKDMFNYNIQANGSFNNHIEAENDLSGFQFGGDAWVCLRQGLRAGVEGKVGVYGNQYDIINRSQTTDLSVDIEEAFEDEQVAFIGEARVMVVADVHPSVSVKLGYEVLLLTSIATAVDNFNPSSPYTEGEGAPRSSVFWTQSDALFHGFHAGIEYIW